MKTECPGHAMAGVCQRSLCQGSFCNVAKLPKFQLKIMASFSSSPDVLIAVCQMTSTNNKDENIKTATNLITESSCLGAKVVFLPECFDYVGENRQQSIELAESLDGPIITACTNLARENKVWLSLGGYHEKGPVEDIARVYNTHLVIDDKGEIQRKYRKTHLFDVEISGGAIMKESEYVIPGEEMVNPVKTPAGNVSLQICYDLRFPELSIAQTQLGAEILTFPSAFTVITGMAHWEVLLRARAIENQCYVVAAAQSGAHNEKRQSYGHSMVIDPWGKIIAQCEEGIGICLANVSKDYLKKIRKEMPVWNHRRNDIYNNPLP